jgi:hypothetical protein
MKQVWVLLLAIVSMGLSAYTTEPVVQARIYVDGRLFSSTQNSVAISAKGAIMVGRIDPVTGEKMSRKFMVVIRRTIKTENFPVLVYDTRYNDGEKFETLDIENVMLKAKAGDEILIIPVDDSYGKAAKITSCDGPYKIVVTGDQC